MTDLSTDTTAPASSEVPSTFITFALKNGAGLVDVDTSKLPDIVYREALMQGLKVIAERGMSKLTKAAHPNESERKAAIKAKAEENIQEMYDGKTKITGETKVKKTSGAEMTEGMRLARALIKDAMKANKIKISTVKSTDITIAAKQYIEENPGILETARDNLAQRAATPVKLDIKALIKPDAELVRKDEAKRAAAKASKPLSKAQAGKVAPRAKAKPQAGAHA